MDVRRSVVLHFRDMCIDPPYVKRNDFLNNYSDCCLVGDHKAPIANVIVIGDSYARHLIPAFNKLGNDKQLSIMFNFKTNCPLYARRDAQVKTKDAFCRKFQKRRWKLLQGIPVKDSQPFPRNSTIVVASFGDYKSIDMRRKRLEMLNADIVAAGHRFMAAGEPPGMFKDELWRFACIDIEKSPLVQIGKMMHFGKRSSSSSSSSSCISAWMKPKGRAQQDWEDYNSIFSNDLPDTPFLDLYGPVCKKDDDRNGEPMCRLLGNVNDTKSGVPDLGYGRDGHHLTVQGSEFLAGIIEKQLPLKGPSEVETSPV